MKKRINVESDTKWKDYSIVEISNLDNEISELITNFKKDINNIEPTFSSLVLKYEILGSKCHKIKQLIWCFTNLHKDEKVRDAAREVDLKISEIINNFNYDEEVYVAFKNYYNNAFKLEKRKKEISAEQIRVVEEHIKGFKKIGLDLPKSEKKKIIKISNKISQISNDYEKLYISSYDNGDYFTKEELVGVPENFLKNLKHDEKNNKYFVSVRPAEISVVTKFCEIESTRKRLAEIAAKGAGDKNTNRLASTLKLRNEIAKILKFKTYSEFATSDEMMNNVVEIDRFLKDLSQKIIPILKKELGNDLKEYNSWLVNNNQKSESKLKSWNWSFAENLKTQKELNVKSEDYKPYFELENCLSVVFKIWEDIFDVKTDVLKGEHFFDSSDLVINFSKKSSGEHLAKGVFDLFPRTGKYGHACINDVGGNCVDENNVVTKNLIYLVCNFMKNSNGKTLLTFDEVKTLFHEAGHFIHFLLMNNMYPSTADVSTDFVEIPSQFHENFVFNKFFVKNNFKNYLDGTNMPEKLLSKISGMNKSGEASVWAMQTMYSIFDQELHGKNTKKYYNYKKIDLLFETLYKKVIGIETVKNRKFTSRFAHLMHGYQAKYYSYVISRVYAQDFWNEFSKGGIKRGKMSEKYKKFLEAANTRPEKDLVKEFLGRKVSLKPFLEILKG